MYRYRTSVNGEMEPDEDGRWVRFEDHLVALAMKDAEIAQWKAEHAEMARRNALGERVRSYDAIVQQLVEKDTDLTSLWAKQRVLIEQLNEKVAAYEGGCLHDQLVAHAQKIEQLEQQNTALRGGVARTCTTMGR